MSDAAKYRALAEECMDLMRTMSADARPRLLKIAEAWLELARAELSRRPDDIQPPDNADQKDTRLPQ